MILNTRQADRKFQLGFTVVELIVVIVVIAILASLTIVAYNGIQNKAHDSTVRGDLQANGKQIEMYTTKNRDMIPNPITNLSTNFNGQYKLKYTANSYRSATYCRDATKVIIAAVSKSGKVFKYDTSEGKVSEVAGTSASCATFGITSTSPSPSLTTVYVTTITGNINGWHPSVDAR